MFEVRLSKTSNSPKKIRQSLRRSYFPTQETEQTCNCQAPSREMCPFLHKLVESRFELNSAVDHQEHGTQHYLINSSTRTPHI